MVERLIRVTQLSNIIRRISIFSCCYSIYQTVRFWLAEKEAFPRHVRVLKHRPETSRNGDQSGNEISNDAFPHHVRVLKRRLGWEMAINRRIDFRIRFHSYFVPSRGKRGTDQCLLRPAIPGKIGRIYAERERIVLHFAVLEIFNGRVQFSLWRC